VFLIFCF
jgi:nucleoside-diphosphate kinase